MIIVRQISALDGFSYEAVDAIEQRIGQIHWPWLAQARNARLRWHAEGSAAGDVRIHLSSALQGDDFRVRHEYLNRRRHPDLRWTLHTGDQVLAAADVRVLSGWRRLGVDIHAPFAGQLIRGGHGWRRAWNVSLQTAQGHQAIGSIEQPSAFMLRQTWVLHLPADMGLPLQLFFAFLALQLH